MSDDGLILLRETAIELVQNCCDPGLLDLLCKLLLESGVQNIL